MYNCIIVSFHEDVQRQPFIDYDMRITCKTKQLQLLQLNNHNSLFVYTTLIRRHVLIRLEENVKMSKVVEFVMIFTHYQKYTYRVRLKCTVHESIEVGQLCL